MTTGETVRKSWRRATGIAVCLCLMVSLNSCVPLLIAAAGVTVGYIARDEGVGQAPPLEGGGFRERTTPAYGGPAPYGDGSGQTDDLGGYDTPVY